MFKYRLKRLARPKVIFWTTFILLFFVSMGSIVRFYAADVTVFEGGVSSNITEDTVIVNDLQADWDYYESLNFTEITSKTALPTGTNSLKYTKDTLVAVQINYDGRDINNANWVGKVSQVSGEGQSKFVYYKYYPIKNGEIKIELIDNPYTWRPKVSTGNYKGFNGWVCDDEKTDGISCSDMEFSYDFNYYLRYVTIPASKVETDNDGNLKMVLNLRATWVDASLATDYTTDEFKKLNEIDMVSLSTEQMQDIKRVYTDYYKFIDGQTYYEKKTANIGESFKGYWINENGIAEDYFTDPGKLCENDLYGNEITPSTDETEDIQKCVYYVETTDSGDAVDSSKGTITKEYWFVETNSDSSISLKQVDYTNGTGLFRIFTLSNVDNGQYKLSGYENGDSLAGLYYKTTLGSDTSLYYNASGQRCDLVNCSTEENEVYKLIQSGDSLKVNGESISTINIHTSSYTQEEDWDYDTKTIVNNGITSSESKYYYLVTRDTNIVYLSGSNKSIAGSTITSLNKSAKKPHTLTGSPSNESITVELSLGTAGLTLYNDMVIENIETGIYTTNNNSTDYRYRTNHIYADYYNLKIGRNIISRTNYFFAGGVIGGSADDTPPENRYSKTIVESGDYYYLKALGEDIVTGWTNVIMQYGSDYDRVKSNDNLLKVARCVTSSFEYGNHKVDNSLLTAEEKIIPAAISIVKSGTYGYYGMNSSGDIVDEIEHFSYGIYTGTFGGGYGNAIRVLKMEGGYALNINGGLTTTDSEIVNATYMTGGTALNVVGGAGSTATQGDRIVSISGGLVRNSIAGGSNSYSGTDGAGPLKSSVFVYVGGHAEIGDGTSIFGVSESGSVFGAGLGNKNSSNYGIVRNSIVVINGGLIHGSVYGGGNYGAVGTNEAKVASSKLIILDGVIEKSVYGGSNQNGFSKNDYRTSSKIDIFVNGGDIKGSLYGGSNITGNVYGAVAISLKGGSIGNVYGGGYGNNTYTRMGIAINTDSSDNSLKIGNLYGGSALGKVNTSSGDTSVTVDGGTITNVYGGGMGDATASISPTTTGNISVVIKSGNIQNVFGGTNECGSVPNSGKTMKVYVTGGNINNVFGGSNGSQASAGNTYVGIAGGTIGNVYGGGNKATVTVATNVEISEGDIQNAFGGGNEATVPTSNITITGGSIAKALYGGGNKAKVDNTTVNVSGGTFTQATENQDMGLGVFGGGANVSDAGAVNTTVNLKSGVSVYNVYGGSNVSGTVTGTATVNAESANIGCNLYGGGFQAEINTSNVSITGSTTFSYTLNTESGETAYNTSCGMAFGGGAAANVNIASNITLNTTGKLIALYGGSNKAGNVAETNVTVKKGVLSAVFGGNNYDGATGKSNVTIKQESGTLSLDNVFGGSNGQNAIIGYEDGNGVYELGTTNVVFNAGTVKQNIFGGGNEAPVYGSTNVTMTAGTVNRVYGGGNKAFIGGLDTTNTKFELNATDETSTAESYVNISGGRIKNNVYGSGNASFVDGNTYVNLASSSSTETDAKTLRIDGSVFGSSETNADEDKTYQYKSIGVSGDAIITIDGTGYFDTDELSTIKINGSIYGGGNNSNTRGSAKLYIDKIGADVQPVSMASIQRFKDVYIKDSIIELNGARDRSLQTRYTYGFVRIDNLYLLGTATADSNLNGSTLYMARGNILLKRYNSGSMTDSYKDFKYQVVNDSDGELTNENSNNKLYMYENIVFAVSTMEEILYDSTSGKVGGMTYLGMYNHGVTGDSLVTGIYDTDLKEGEIVGNSVYSAITSDAYTYVYGYHEFEPAQQIVTHGFYTNKVDDDRKIDVDYVGVTPLNLSYYKWVIGEERKQILVDLEASKNSTRESQNVKITLDELKEQIGDQTFNWRDATMQINTVDTSTFKAAKDDVTTEFDTILVDKTDIDAVNVNDDNGDGVVDANNYFALTMGTTSEGWLDNFRTNFYDNGYDTENDFCDEGSIGDCTGNNTYVYDSTTLERGLTFWLDHSKNLDFSISTATDRENAIISLGTVTIKTIFTNPHADPGSANQQVDVDIVITITMTDSTRDVYGAAIAPGIKTTVFSTATTSIPTNGVFSIYQALSLDLNQPMMKDETKMWDVNELYGQERTATNGDQYSESYRYLASNYLFPKGTKITLLDLVMNEQYYYEVTKENSDKVKADSSGSEYRYMLEDFIRMGSTSADNKYDDDMNGENSTKYYINEDNGKIKFAIEEFVFNVDFSNVAKADMIQEVQKFYLFMQLSSDKNGAENVILNPDGDPTEGMSYTLNPDITSEIKSSGGFTIEGTEETSPSTEIYVGEDTNLKLYTTFVNQRKDGEDAEGVTNTTYEKYKLGALITIMRPSKDEHGNVITDSDGNIDYEQVTTDMFGTVFTINGQKYYPQVDGTTRLQLAGRISDVISDINIDFSNSGLVYGDYKIVIKTFASYDGLYYGDADVVTIELPFKLLNNQYGLNVTIPPEQVTHDVNTGLDKNGSNIINYIVDTKNGVADPYLRISLQRRNYNSYYENAYTNIDLKKIATSINIGEEGTNILDICYPDDSDTCEMYTLVKMDSSKETEKFEVNMTLKEGPTATDLADLSTSGWKSGTYRVVFTLYDGDVPVGSVYEYLIIRSLDVDEIIEGSAN